MISLSLFFLPVVKLLVLIGRNLNSGITTKFRKMLSIVNYSYNAQQIEWFKAGGALNIIRRNAEAKA